MGKIFDFKNIEHWDEIFDMTYDFLTFLIEEERIKPELVIKTTYDILKNAEYGYSLEDVSKEYYKVAD